MPSILLHKNEAENLSEKQIIKLIQRFGVDEKCTKLKDYYIGKHSILKHFKNDATQPNNRIINNMAKYITDTAIGYFIGKPVVYMSDDDNFIKNIQDIYNYNDEQDINSELAKMTSVYGYSYEMMYIDEDGEIRFLPMEPNSTLIIKDAVFKNIILAIRIIKSNTIDGYLENIEVFDNKTVKIYEKQNDKLIFKSEIEHYWKDVPFVEYINNEEYLGDYEGVISIIDAYNKVQSNTANFFEYNDNALLKIMKLGGDISAGEIKEMKEQGAIILEDGGDIDWLLKSFDDGAMENYKRRLREDMHIFSSIPNMTDDSFNSSLSGIAVSYKLWSLEQVCAIKERKFKKGLQRRVELITNILNIKGANYNYRDIEIQFRRNKPQNLVEIAQIITMLSNDLSRESRLKMLPNVEDVALELEKLKAEKLEEINDLEDGDFDINDFISKIGGDENQQ